MTVRNLCNMPNGECSAGVLSMLNKGDVITISKKTYSVTSNAKGKQKDGCSYRISNLRFKDTNGKTITSQLWEFDNGNTFWSGNANHDSLSRDIEGDLIVDLINEHNPFHKFSDSYKLVAEYIKKYNEQAS